ncbi:Serine/threonine-protein kinase tel1 [Maublancomyces gigas]|uniref:Serine/threonine-protein kinase tel1 n=1 Tax=Discina gigas TaxID=1032678 RepID=A0ABR3GXZ8_9PEZI
MRLFSKISIDPNRKYLNDKGFHKMFEAIFRAAIKEKTLYARQQKESLRKTIGNRLSLCGSVFRLAVELGVKHIKSKTFKAVYKHIVDILPQAGEGLCEPISLDYIKALRVCLEYAPHTEHLPGEDWEMIATFCCTHVESQLGLLGDGDENKDSDEDMDSREVLHVGNSRPNLVRDTSSTSRISSPSPQVASVKLNHNSQELLLCLQILLRTPNAPVVRNSEMTCKTILGFLTSQGTVTNGHQAALSTLNSILETITTNNLALSTKIAEDIIPVISKIWGSKLVAIQEQMIITLIYIQPYLRKIICSPGSQARNLRRKLEALSEVIFGEYTARAERDQFQLDDLVFPNPCKTLDAETTPLGLPAYCLRNDAPPRIEQQWIVPYLIAMIIDTLDRADSGTISRNRLDQQSSSKRRKVSKHFDELLRNVKSTILSPKICALQTLPFLISGSRRNMDQEEFSSVVANLLSTCSDDNPVISSWAILSIAR